MRVFYSFHLPERAAEMMLRDIVPTFDGVPYPKDNLHVTLRFIGEVEESVLEALCAIGASVGERFPAISFAGKEIHVEKNGRVKLELQADRELYDLYASLEAALREAQIALRPQQFMPHVTLGRLAADAAVPGFSGADLQRYQFMVREFGLYRSEPGEDTLGRYALLKEFPLLGN